MNGRESVSQMSYLLLTFTTIVIEPLYSFLLYSLWAHAIAQKWFHDNRKLRKCFVIWFQVITDFT